jgi:2-keto-4-pentenoate hydratase
MSLIWRAVRPKTALVAGAILASSLALAAVVDNVGKQIDVIYRAWASGKPSPVISHTMATFTLEDAYAIQHGYVELRLKQDSIRGYKGGMTTPQVQKQFGMEEPVVGVLLATGEVTSKDGKPPAVSIGEFHKLMIETEVGFVFEKPIDAPLATIDELKSRIRAVIPAIELPDLGFSDPAHLRGLDVVANNVSARRFIFGAVPDQKKFLEGHMLDGISAELRCNDRPLNVGKATDVMGSQWQAALWEVNKLVALGYRIEPGQVLISGAMGRMVPAQPGSCVADFGAFGRIMFEVTALAAKAR